MTPRHPAEPDVPDRPSGPTRRRPVDGPGRRLERPPPLAGVRAVVRRDDRAVRGEPRRRRHELRRGGVEQRPGEVRGGRGVRRLRRGERRPRARRRSQPRPSSCWSSRTRTGRSRTPRTAPRSATWRPGSARSSRRSTARPGPVFEELVDPTQAPPEAGLVSPDGSTVRIVARVPGDGDVLVAPARARARRSSTSSRPTTPTRHPPAEQHAHQRRDPGADQRRPRRLAAAHDPADVPDPADRVRGGGRGGHPAGPGDHGAAGGVRDPRPVQPGGLAGQPVREPADRADRPGGRGRLLAVHADPVPDRAAPRPAEARRDPRREQHRRAGRVLLRARGDDLDRRAVPARRPAVPVDGGRDDRGRARRGHRLAHVPAGDARDPRRRREPAADPDPRPRPRGGQRHLGAARPGRHAPAGRSRPSPPRPSCCCSPRRPRGCTWARPTSRRSRTRSTASRRSTCSTRSGRRAGPWSWTSSSRMPTTRRPRRRSTSSPRRSSRSTA